MIRITHSEYKALASSEAKRKAKKSKYGAIPTMVDNIRFHSKKEAAFYQKLKIIKDHNDIKYFLMQVPFRLPGNIRYLCDFMVVDLNNTIRFIDIKGRDTPISLLKRKQVLDIYGVEIEVI